MQLGPKCGFACMGVKSKRVLFSHLGNVIMTATKIKFLGGTTNLEGNMGAGVITSSAVCTCISWLSLSCSTPSGPHVIPN